MTNVETFDGVTTDDLRFMDENIRELERQDFLREYPSVYEGLVTAATSSKVLRTLRVDGKAAAIWGITGPQQIGDAMYVNVPWLALAEFITEHPYFVLKTAKRWWDDHYRPARYPALYNWVPVEDEPAQRFLRFLGFTVYTDRVHEQNGGRYYAFIREAPKECA